MNKKFEYYLQEIKAKRIKKKFVIVLGSGFHKQAFKGTPDTFNFLTSWCCLLKEIDSKTSFSNNFLLDFEKIILKRTNNQDEKAAYKIEEDILKNVVLHSVATAFANIVLPVPGGPNKITPLQGSNYKI